MYPCLINKKTSNQNTFLNMEMLGKDKDNLYNYAFVENTFKLKLRKFLESSKVALLYNCPFY